MTEKGKGWDGLHFEEEKKPIEKVTLKNLVSYVHLYEEGKIDSDTMNQIVLLYVSEDEKAIPNILKILDTERKRNKELLQDTNLELSRAFVAFEMYEKNTPQNLKQKRWIYSEIKKHYIKWRNYIGCCFKVVGLND